MKSYQNCFHSSTVAICIILSCSSDITRCCRMKDLSKAIPSDLRIVALLSNCHDTRHTFQRFKSQCNIWYMDDGTMGDDVNTLLADFQFLMVEGRKTGSPRQCRHMRDHHGRCRRVAENREHRTRHQAPQASISHTAAWVHQLEVNRALTKFYECNWTNYDDCRTECRRVSQSVAECRRFKHTMLFFC